MYKSAKVISQWSVAVNNDGEESEHEVLQNETQTKLPPVDDWRRFTGTPEPGNFFTFDLQATRRKLLVWEVSQNYLEEWD